MFSVYNEFVLFFMNKSMFETFEHKFGTFGYKFDSSEHKFDTLEHRFICGLTILVRKTEQRQGFE